MALASGILFSCGTGIRTTACNPSAPWRTVDDWTTPSEIGVVTAIAHGLAVTPNNTVFTAVYHGRGTGPQGKWVVRRGRNAGSQWETVDDFTYSTSTTGAQAYNVWIDPVGRIIAQGAGFDASNVSRWVARISDDNGDSWRTLDDYSYLSGFEAAANFNQTGIAVDSRGAWYSSGTGADSVARRWIVRKSVDQGVSWSVVLDYQYVAGQASGSRGVYVDVNQDLYTFGQGNDALGVGHWLVLRSSDFGASWSVVDDFLLAPGQSAVPKGLIAIDQSTLLVAGGGSDSSGALRWFIRRSLDRGATWETTDLITEAVGSAQTEIVEDAQRHLYTGGLFGISPTRHPTLRRSTDRGRTWSTVDQLTADSFGASAMRAIARGPDNALYTVSQTVESTGRNHIIVRKRDCW